MHEGAACLHRSHPPSPACSSRLSSPLSVASGAALVSVESLSVGDLGVAPRFIAILMGALPVMLPIDP